jgi:hypothetical protein
MVIVEKFGSVTCSCEGYGSKTGVTRSMLGGKDGGIWRDRSVGIRIRV